MTAREIAQSEASDSRAEEAFHFITKRCEHAANLSLDPPPQNNAQTRRRHGVEPFDTCAFAIHKNSFA